MLYALIGVPVVAVLGLFVYLGWRIDRPPSGTARQIRASEGHPVLLCLGDSITHGNLGGNWVDGLRTRFAASGRLVANAGINGQQAWNVAQRLDRELSCKPDLACLMIGSNDVMAADRPDRAAAYVKQNELPRTPDLEWSLAELEALVPRIVAAVPRVALCTIPPLGDDDQQPIAALVARYNDRVRSLAEQHGCVLLDVHEAIVPLLSDAKTAYQGAQKTVIRLVGKVAAHHYLMNKSWDDIARSLGYGATAEGIHLSDTAAARVEELVAGFVRDAEA
ncbi:MAG: SGNH/GDSL hydrolase family protein [Myxococcota bacterium]